MKLFDYVDQNELTELVTAGFVGVRKHPEAPLSILNYTHHAQASGDWSNDTLRKCRGLIYNYDTLEIVAIPWAKFFNYGDDSKTGPLDPNVPVNVTNKMDGCFPNDARLNLWGGGTVKIGDVVKNHLTPTLIGMDENGNLVPTQVVDWHDNGVKDDWMRVGLSTPASGRSGAAGHENRMFVTPNHHVYVDGEYVPASDLKVGDILVASVPTFTNIDLFLGGLLGDGSICRNGNGFNYQECHGESQRKYVEDQRALFLTGGLGETSDTQGGYANTPKIWLQTNNAEVFRRLRAEWYPDGIKIVPFDLSFLNDAVVAKWFMDDGSRSHSLLQRDRALFHTNGFTEAEVYRLAARLKEMYGVSITVHNAKGWQIRINYAKGTINTFWSAIAPYVFPSMEYKLPDEFRGQYNWLMPSPIFGKDRRDSEVTSVEFDTEWNGNNYGRSGAHAYDIETETHNYMCQGVLVHNSLGILYHTPDGRKWVATRGSFDSPQAVHATEWLRTNMPNYDWDGWITPLVEIIYPENRIVLNYGADDKLVLLGATYQLISDDVYYLSAEDAQERLGWNGEVTETFLVNSLAAALALPPRENAEGVVVRFNNNAQTMVKVKQEDYLRLHRILYSLSNKFIWDQLVKSGTCEFDLEPEIKALLPKEIIDWVYETLDNYVFAAWEVYKAATLHLARYQDLQMGPDYYKTVAISAQGLDPAVRNAVLMLMRNDYDQGEAMSKILYWIGYGTFQRPQNVTNEEE